MSIEKRIKIYSTPDALKAQMLQMALRDAGVESEIENPHQAGLTGAVNANVTVTEADAEKATQVVHEIDERSKTHTLVVTAFDNEATADEVQLSLRKMDETHLIDLEDSVVIIRGSNGKVAIKQTHNLTQNGAVAGGLCGTIVGAMFMNPVIGFVAGAAVGAAVGATEDIGINDEFLKDVGDLLTPGTSALAILIRRSDPELVLPELEKFAGKVLKTALVHTDEKRFLTVLAASTD